MPKKLGEKNHQNVLEALRTTGFLFTLQDAPPFSALQCVSYIIC